MTNDTFKKRPINISVDRQEESPCTLSKAIARGVDRKQHLITAKEPL